MQRDIPELPFPWYGDPPLVFSGRESRQEKFAPAVDESGPYPAWLRALQWGINRHALRNSSEIELDASRQCHLPAYRVYLNTAPSSSRLSGNDGIESSSRKLIERPVIAELHQLIQHGWIVHPLSDLGRRKGSCQDTVEQIADCNGRSRALIKLRQLTLREETAQCLF